MLDFGTVEQWIQIGTSHKYLALAIAVIGWLVSLTSTWSKFPINVSKRYQPLVAILLGLVYGVLLDHQNGHSWGMAIVSGAGVGLASAGAYDAFIKAAFNGKVPAWMAVLSFAHPPVEASPPHEEAAVSVREPHKTDPDIHTEDNTPTEFVNPEVH